MKTKNIIWMMIFILLLTACSNGLDEYKTSKIDELQAYGQVKVESADCLFDTEVIFSIIFEGKEAIELAPTQSIVDEVFKSSIDAINDVVERMETTETNYKFISLSKAFSQKLIFKEDLLIIAQYINTNTKPSHPDILSNELIDRINTDYIKSIGCKEETHDICIEYYGQYRNVVAVMVSGCEHENHNVLDSEVVDGVTFNYNTTQRIYIWVDLSLTEDYNMEELEMHIKEDFLVYLWNKGELSYTIDKIEILLNYGIYSNCVVVRMNRGAYLVGTKIEIDGIQFIFADTNSALVWKDGNFFELVDAFERKMISREDLIKIADIQNNNPGLQVQQ
jgi:uncharacterized membrane protein